MILKAFVLRDLRTEMSYRLYFIWRVFSILFAGATLFFLSRMMGAPQSQGVLRYTDSYFEYAIVGMALAETMWSILGALGYRVRQEQVLGTLEAVLAAPVPRWRILASLGAYPLAVSGVRVLMYFAVGVLMGARFEFANVIAVIPVVLLCFVVFGALGAISAALTLVLKRGEPITTFFGAASVLFGGVLYPTSTLPPFLESFSTVLPITHAVDAVRGVLLGGMSYAEVSSSLLVLVGFALGASVAAALTLRFALNFVGRHGGLRGY